MGIFSGPRRRESREEAWEDLEVVDERGGRSEGASMEASEMWERPEEGRGMFIGGIGVGPDEERGGRL